MLFRLRALAAILISAVAVQVQAADTKPAKEEKKKAASAVIISASHDSTGSHPGTAPVSGPTPVKCLSASSHPINTDYPPSCYIAAPGVASSVKPGDTVGTSGAGTVTLTCNGQGELHCSAQVGK